MKPCLLPPLRPRGSSRSLVVLLWIIVTVFEFEHMGAVHKWCHQLFLIFSTTLFFYSNSLIIFREFLLSIIEIFSRSLTFMHHQFLTPTPLRDGDVIYEGPHAPLLTWWPTLFNVTENWLFIIPPNPICQNFTLESSSAANNFCNFNIRTTGTYRDVGTAGPTHFLDIYYPYFN